MANNTVTITKIQNTVTLTKNQNTVTVTKNVNDSTIGAGNQITVTKNQNVVTVSSTSSNVSTLTKKQIDVVSFGASIGSFSLLAATDTVFTGLADKDLIQFNLGTGNWENIALDSIGLSIEVKSAGVSVDTNVAVLDFSNEFTIGETPEDEVNISFNFANISHTSLQDIGSNTHAQIDIHIGDVTGNPHVVTFTQTVTADTGTDITAAEAETLTDTSNADSLHTHTSGIDHGNLSGLADDDHTQYSLVDGTRAFTGTIAGITPVGSADLATKAYIDGLINGLDWQESVLDKDLVTAPGAPGTGDRYIIAGTGGLWSPGTIDDIAEFDGAAWFFVTPDPGFAAFVEDEKRAYLFNLGSWVFFGTIIDHQALIGAGTNDHAAIDTHIDDGTIHLNQEQVEDIAGAMTTGNTETLITVTYQDGDGTIDFVVDNNLANYDNSSSGFITATLTNEEVEDIAGPLVATGGTKTLITVTYQDTTGDMDFVVNNDLANYSNANSNFLSAGAVIADNAVVRGDGGTRATQDSGVIIDDSDNMTGVNDLTVLGSLFGGPDNTDDLDLFANDETFDPTDAGRINPHNFMVFNQSFTDDNTGATRNVFTISGTVTYDSATTAGIYTGLLFNPTISYNTASALTGAIGVFANQTWSDRAGVAITLNAVTGFDSRPMYEVNNDASTGSIVFFTGINGQPQAVRGSGKTGTATIENMDCFITNQAKFFVTDIGAGITVDDYRHFRADSIGNSGTVTTEVCFFGVAVPAGTNYRVLDSNSLSAASNHFFLFHDGGAVSELHGDVNIVDAKLAVRAAAVGDVVQTLESVATNDDPIEQTIQNRLTTTNDVFTTIATIAIPASTTVAITTRVIGRRTGGSSGTAEDGAFFKRTATFKNVGGTATQIQSTASEVTQKDQTSFNFQFAISSGNVLLQVKGNTNNNLTWHTTTRVYKVSS